MFAPTLSYPVDVLEELLQATSTLEYRLRRTAERDPDPAFARWTEDDPGEHCQVVVIEKPPGDLFGRQACFEPREPVERPFDLLPVQGGYLRQPFFEEAPPLPEFFP